MSRRLIRLIGGNKLTTGELEYAKRKARELTDKWIDATGIVDFKSSYYYELMACIDDAVDIGARVANGEKIDLNHYIDGE